MTKKIERTQKYAGKGKHMVRVSYTPNTWIEVDDALTDEQVEEKIKRFKQLTGTK